MKRSLSALLAAGCIAAFCFAEAGYAQDAASGGASVTAPAAIAPAPTAAALATQAGFDLQKLPLVKFGHADVQTAAAYATANGYPARAAFWLAVDQQVTACEDALAAAAPRAPAAGGTIGLATAFEVAAEAVGTGIPPKVTVNCSLITLPRLL